MKTIEFKPSFSRYLVTNSVLFVGGMALALALSGLLFPPFDFGAWLFGVLLTCVGIVVVASVEYAILHQRFVVSVDPQEIYTWKHKQALSLNKVDMEKSRQRRARDILLGRYQICSTNGDRINIAATTHSWREYLQILETASAFQNTSGS